MERPKKIPKEVLPYIEFIEEQLTSNTIDKKWARGVERQLGFLADELLSNEMKLSLTDEKEVDRFIKRLEKYKVVSDAIKTFKNVAYNAEVPDVKKVVKEDGVEQFIKSTTIATTT